jgi:glycosyltransferase involved in cell wall biosynthesis
MRVLHLSTNDKMPGASRAAYRLHKGLQNLGIDSMMLVQNKESDDESIFPLVSGGGASKVVYGLRQVLDPLPLRLYPNQCSSFSLQWLPSRVVRHVNKLNPDIVCLHWVCGGYVSIETLAKFKKPIVWILRDMWPFTGGCHYSDMCDLYKTSCGRCPILKSKFSYDASAWVFQRKLKSWKDIDLTIVALSSWIGDCARSSTLFQKRRIEVIPNGLDIQTYRPIDKFVARSILNLSQDKRLLIFGAVKATSDSRKGFDCLYGALQRLNNSYWKNNLEIVIFGASKPEADITLDFKTHYLGYLSDDYSLNIAYSAADVLVAPSRQENLANTVLESLACGTPSVAFSIGGMPDLIDHHQNGYLAEPFSIPDLARGIEWVLEDKDRSQKLSVQARSKVEAKFDIYTSANSHKTLYSDILGF